MSPRLQNHGISFQAVFHCLWSLQFSEKSSSKEALRAAWKGATRQVLFYLTFDHFLLFLWNYLNSCQRLWWSSLNSSVSNFWWNSNALEEASTQESERDISSLDLSSIHVTVSWLRGLLIADHLVLDSDENLLHGVLWVPVFEHVEGLLNLSIWLVNTWKVHFGIELDFWGLHWIVITTGDGHHVDPVVEVGVWWTNDGTIPVCERLIVT